MMLLSKSKMTIREIAKEAKVSIATISRFLTPDKKHLVHPKTAKKIDRIIEKHRYIPNLSARNLASLKRDTLGLVTPQYEGAFQNEYNSKLISGILRAAGSKGYGFKLLTVDHPLTSNEWDLLTRSNYLAGVLVNACRLIVSSFDAFQYSNIPTVLLNDKTNLKEMSYVSSNNFDGSYQATRYLISKGHRAIAIFRGNPNSGDDIARYEGFKAALCEVNLPLHPEWIFCGDFIEEGGYRCGKKLLLLKDRPTALFCANDDMARGFYRALSEMDLKCPDDISCIGYDDNLLSAYLNPPLTTVSQPVEKMGITAAQWILDKLSNPSLAPIRVELENPFVIRKSVRQIC